MLEIRYLRSGRRNTPFFRIVLTESSKPPKSGFIEILGWYNPVTKESSLKKEDILVWLNKGAQPSNSFCKLLEKNKITHKSIKFVKSAEKAPKKKGEKKEKPAAPKEATEAAVKPEKDEVTENPEEIQKEENTSSEPLKEKEVEETEK
ncbi:MAG: 30S ribosomal protein S16 [Candidatus Berkelbacteria bacterium]|nr:30S ribosomal protein S16 [Candidatus Berkelbacteria bacterium]